MQILFFVLLLISQTSCQKEKNANVDCFVYDSTKVGKMVLITDSLIQGKAVIVRYYKKFAEENNIYCSYMYYIKNDDRFNTYNLKSPNKITANYFEFIDTVPNNASTGFIEIYDVTKPDALGRIHDLAIFKANNEFEMGATSNWLKTYGDSSNYIEYFRYDIEEYPDNYISYAKKWLFELNNKIFNQDIADKDYKIILNAKNIDNATRDVLLFIIKSFKDKVIDKQLLDRIAQYKNIDVLNSETVRVMIMRILEHHLNAKNGNDILSIIAYNNPLSKLTASALASGELFDWMAKDKKDSLLEIGRKFYQSAPERTLNIIYYLRCINESGYGRDSVLVVQNLCEKLVDRLAKQEHLKLGIDRGNHLLMLKSFIFQSLITSGKELNKQQYNIDLIKKYEKYIKNYEIETCMYYLTLAQLFEDISIDSACIYYAKANKINKMSSIQKGFSKLISKIKPNVDVLKYLDSLTNTIQFDKETLNYDVPVVELETGDKLNLNKLDKPLILFNSSITCTFCHKEILALANSKLTNITYKPLLLFIDRDDFENKKSNGLLPKNFDCKFIQNGDAVKRYFNMYALPTTVIINNNNELVYFSSGFDDSNINGILSALEVK